MTLKNLSPVLWFCAFLCSLFFINDWQLELFGAAVFVLFIWAILTLTPRNQQGWAIPKSFVLGLMSAFWFLVFLSVFNSDILNVSFMAFCFFSVLPLSFLVMAIKGKEKDFILIAQLSAVLFSGLSIWAMAQFYFLPDIFGGRAHHPLTNPNSLAALFNLGFFCAVGWMLGSDNKRHSNLALIVSILIFGGIVATGSRGALLSLLPVLLFFLIIMRQQAASHKRCLSIMFVCCALLFMSTTIADNPADSIALRAIDNSATDFNDLTSNRISLWKASIAMIKEHGLLGTGIGTYFLYFQEFRLPEDRYGAYYAHSDPLQYWVELGVLGPILFYAFLIAVAIRTKKAFYLSKGKNQKIILMSCFCALTAVILHTHVTFNLYNLSILFGCGFLLAVWFWQTQQILKTQIKEILFPKNYSLAMKAFSISLPFIMIGFLFGAYIISEHYTNKARDYLLSGDVEAFASNVVKANRISFNANYRSYLLAVTVPISLLEKNDNNFDEKKKKEIFDQGLSYLRHVRSVNPRSSSALFYLGKIQQISPSEFILDDMEEPKQYYKQALHMDPTHVGARLELSQIYEAEGKKDQALKLLEAGKNIKYASSNAMNLYAQLMTFYLESGNTEGRDEMIARMRAFQGRLDRAERLKSKTVTQHIWGN